MNYKITIFKLNVERIIIQPFIIIGRFIARFKPLKDEYEFFFFFPFFHTGGVEKYNAAVAEALSSRKGIIFFTKKSADENFLNAFKSSGHRIIDISKYTDNKWIYFCNLTFRGILSFYINNQRKKSIVFNGQSNFAYKLSPWIKKEIRQIECIHTFSTFSKIRLPFIKYYEFALSPSYKTINDHIAYYKKLGVPDSESKKFKFLITGIDTTELFTNKEKNKPLKVIFVGRGSKEKRVEIAAEIAKNVKEHESGISFEFIGNVENFIPQHLKKFCIIHGNISDKETLETHYKNADILLITSSFEGFPLVVMEGMNYGLAIISTAVGDVPLHVKNDINGYIADASIDDNNLIKYMSDQILYLNSHRNLLQIISKENHSYALTQFSIKELSNKLSSYLNYPTFEK